MSRHYAAPEARIDAPLASGSPGEARPLERLSTSSEVGFPREWYALNSADHFWFEWRMQAALRQWRACAVPLAEPLRVLDVGGGRGVLRDQVEAATDWTVDLVELNQAALEAASPGRGRHLYYDVLDRRSDLLGRYDAVLMFDVIEHVQAPRPVLDAVAQHLKPGGLLLLNVPALPSLFGAYDVAAGHHRRYHRGSLRAELAGGDWEVEDVRYWGLGLLPPLALRKMLLRSATDETIHRSFGPFNRLAQACLRGLMRVEMATLRRSPIGTSLLMVARRRGG